jgi:lipopolysaccharide/colanic/teichoic acid biosynthesis glycosyltransferase
MSPSYENDAAVAVMPFEAASALDLGQFEESVVVYETAKRAIDIILASIALIILSPLLVLVAVVIKLSDFGPVLFVQERVGRYGKTFKCVKFRTMVPNAEQFKASLMEQSHHNDLRTFKIPRDPRITRVGRVLRKTSIDELMQLWNVLIGDMSMCQDAGIFRLKIRCVWILSTSKSEACGSI